MIFWGNLCFLIYYFFKAKNSEKIIKNSYINTSDCFNNFCRILSFLSKVAGYISASKYSWSVSVPLLVFLLFIVEYSIWEKFRKIIKIYAQFSDGLRRIKMNTSRLEFIVGIFWYIWMIFINKSAKWQILKFGQNLPN